MKLKVPFFKQTNMLNCGPAALRMVLAYFGKDDGLEVLESRAGMKEGKGVYTIQIATAAAASGFRTDFYSKCIVFNEEHMKHEFYQKYNDLDMTQSKKWVDAAKAAGVNVQKRTLLLKELLDRVTKNSLPIILLDWNIVKARTEKGYQGHFVVVVGFDKQNVYLHNPGLSDTPEFMPVLRTTFDEARRAEGTDEDVIIIFRK